MVQNNLKASDFDYNLADDRIAKYPLSNRNESKLLHYQNGKITNDVFKNLDKHLPDQSLLVFNDTKVLAARLYFKKKTGAKIEIFCLEPHQSTAEQALSSTDTCTWQCLVGNLKRFKEDDVLELEIAGTTLRAKWIEKRSNDILVQFDWDHQVDFSSILMEAGEVPLPPYLNRSTEEKDIDSYQTVYAKTEGAVAAPTAGLHFVDSQLSELQSKGHELSYLTLYVGAGTFRPVKAEKLLDHEMHSERIVISYKAIEQLIQHHESIVTVGTTSLRSLESLYWLACNMYQKQDDSIRFVGQEDAYQLNQEWSYKDACEYILNYLKVNDFSEIDFHSALFIMPGYQFKSIKAIITNFHQPKSTLLSLVSAWIGDDWKKVYAYAMNNDYRFLSFGDSSLLIR